MTSPKKISLSQTLATSNGQASELLHLPQSANSNVKNSADYSRRERALRGALASLEQIGTAFPSGNVRQSTERMYSKITKMYQGLNGTAWQVYLDNINQPSNVDTSGRSSKSAQLETLLILAGDRWGLIEKNVFSSLERAQQISGEDRTRSYLPARLASWRKTHDDVSPLSVFRDPRHSLFLKGAASQVGPFIPSTLMWTYGAPIFGDWFPLVTGAALGLSNHLRQTFGRIAENGADSFGVNRLDAKHPIVTFVERLQQQTGMAALDGTTPQIEIALKVATEIKTLSERLAGTTTRPSRHLVVALAALDQYIGILKNAMNAAPEKASAQLVEAQRKLVMGISEKTRKQLNNEMQTIEAVTKEAWTEQDVADLNVVLQAHGLIGLSHVNPVLADLCARFLTNSGTEIGGENPHASTEHKLTIAELTALRCATGESPSMNELLGVALLVKAGLCSFSDVWPAAPEIDGIEDPAAFLQNLENIAPGRHLQAAAEALAWISNYGTSIGSSVLTGVLGWTGLMSLWSVVPYVLGTQLGQSLGGYLSGKAQLANTLQGSAIEKASPVHDPFALVLERWSAVNFGAEQKALSADYFENEAKSIEILASDLLARLKGASENPALPDVERNFVRDVPLFIGMQIARFADELRQIPARFPAEEWRRCLAEARNRLVLHPKMLNAISLMNIEHFSQSLHEPLAPLRSAREQFVSRIAEVMNLAQSTDAKPTFFELVTAAESVAKLQRKGQVKDVVDKFAQHVVNSTQKTPLRSVSARAARTIIEKWPDIQTRWEHAHASENVVPESQLRVSASQWFNNYWEHFVKVFLLPSDRTRGQISMPELYETTITALPNSENRVVRSRMGADGFFQAEFNKFGAIVPESIDLHWDYTILSQVALEIVFQHRRAADGKDAPWPAIVKVLENADEIEFHVREQQGGEHVINMMYSGFLNSPPRSMASV